MAEQTIEAADELAAPAEPTREEAIAQLRARQNLALAIPAGIGAALLGAVLWAAFSYATGYELGIVVIAIGAAIGYAIRQAGHGIDPVFGIVGGACAALSWALGTVLSDVGFLAQQAGRPFFEVLGLLGVGPSIQFAIDNIEAMDFLFLAIAVWEGWKFSHGRLRG
jgi:hypothetical protein